MSENLFPLLLNKDAERLVEDEANKNAWRKTQRDIGFIGEVGFVKRKRNKKALRNVTARKMFALAHFFYL